MVVKFNYTKNSLAGKAQIRRGIWAFGIKAFQLRYFRPILSSPRHPARNNMGNTPIPNILPNVWGGHSHSQIPA